MAKKDREKRKARIASAAGWASKSKGEFERTSVDAPEGVSFFSPKKEGTYRLEMIPYVVGKGNPAPNVKPGDLYFERTYYNHPRIGADGNSYVCLQKTFGKKCPICEHRVKLEKKGEDEDMVAALLPKQRQLFNVLDLNEPEKGVQIWEISHHNFGKHLAKKIRGADEEDMERYVQFFNPSKKGYTLRLNATEETMGKNHFLVFTDIEFRDRKEALDEALLDEAVCLDDLLIEKSYDELKKILLQMPDDDDEPKNKKKGKDDEETEDETEDDSSEEGDDEEDSDDESDGDEGDDEETEFSVGDKVEYIYRGKRMKGKLKKIKDGKNGKIAGVDIGKEDLQWVDLDELLEPKNKWDESEDEDGNEDEDEEDSEADEDGEDSEDEDSDDSDDDEDSEDEDEDEDGDSEEEEDEEDDEPIDDDEPKPKKRGRPKGSKNKKHDDDDD